MITYIVIGIVLLLIIGMIASAVAQRRQDTWLALNGQRVEATITFIKQGREPAAEPLLVQTPNIGQNLELVTPWQNYYYVTAAWTNPETQENHTFKSDRLKQLPSGYAEGKKIYITLDPHDPMRYKF